MTTTLTPDQKFLLIEDADCMPGWSNHYADHFKTPELVGIEKVQELFQIEVTGIHELFMHREGEIKAVQEQWLAASIGSIYTSHRGNEFYLVKVV